MVPEERRRRFGSEFDVRVELDPPGCRACFGLNMLGELVAGIDEFAELRQERWRAFRAVGPVLLGCAMWFDDPELVQALGRLAGAGVVIKKQGRGTRDQLKLAQLAALNERTLGFRSQHRGDQPPIVHAKLALLGQLCWHDEDALGHVADVFFFRPKRLWLSSANCSAS